MIDPTEPEVDLTFADTDALVGELQRRHRATVMVFVGEHADALVGDTIPTPTALMWSGEFYVAYGAAKLQVDRMAELYLSMMQERDGPPGDRTEDEL